MTLSLPFFDAAFAISGARASRPETERRSGKASKKGARALVGEYVVSDKNRHHVSNIYHASMPFFQRFSFSAFGLHQGNLPGYPASHGCIRLSYEGARYLFGKLEVGDYAVVQE
ncbi:MAG TPA: L,D-transpeptidase family protein [Bacteroidia bacterium]|nr:L,D-transpeptidase family protein [Bacteroidia bacterium]